MQQVRVARGLFVTLPVSKLNTRAGEVVKTLRMDCQGREWDNLQLYMQYPELQKLSVFGRVTYRFLAQFEDIPDLRELRLEPDSYRK